MQRRITWLFALLTLMLAGCTKNEFKVEFRLDKGVNSTYTLLYYASDPAKGWLVEQGVSLQDGKNDVTGVTRNPTLVWILSPGGTSPVTFYAERGDKIEITGKGANPNLWDIQGNKINKSLSQWRKENARALERGDLDEINKGVEKYVMANPTDPVSTLLLLTVYSRATDEGGFQRCWKQLKGEALDAEWLDLVGRSDITGGHQTAPAVPKTMVFHTAQSGSDTIRPGKVPILLYFNRSQFPGNRNGTEPIKRISRAWPDSTKRLIIDVSFDPDSSSRVYPTRRDSLEKVLRVWMPLGYSDPIASRLGVSRLPYAIVIGADGRLLYSGSDTERATAAFGAEMDKRR